MYSSKYFYAEQFEAIKVSNLTFKYVKTGRIPNVISP